MATYKHGVYTSEQATSMTAPVTGTAGLQVVVGTAPVNMLEQPGAGREYPAAGVQLQGGCGRRGLP